MAIQSLSYIKSYVNIISNLETCHVLYDLTNYKNIHVLKFASYLHYNKNKNIRQQIIVM